MGAQLPVVIPRLGISQNRLNNVANCTHRGQNSLVPPVDSPLLRLRCAGCGYGASARQEPARCPMCGGVSWLAERKHAVSDLTHDLVAAARRAAQSAGADADAPLLREAVELSVFPGVPLS
jgi:hypothetical protein